MQNQSLIKKLAEIRQRMDNEMKLFADGAGSRTATSMMELSRAAIGRACLYLGSPNPYPNLYNPNNTIIEDGCDLSDNQKLNPIPGNYFVDTVAKKKGALIVCTAILAEIVEIRIKPANAYGADMMYLFTKAIDRAVDHLENAIALIISDLRDLKENFPEDYNESLGGNDSMAPEDAVRTNSMIEAKKLKTKSHEKDKGNSGDEKTKD